MRGRPGRGPRPRRQTFPVKAAARLFLQAIGGAAANAVFQKSISKQQLNKSLRAAPIGPPLAMVPAGKTPDRQNAGAILPKWRETPC